MLTASSSAEVISFQASQSANRKGSFEAWRESWLRAVFADENLWSSDKSVAAFLNFHLNRETRNCFPSYATIGRGIGRDRLNVRRSIKRLVARGYLTRERRGRGQSNLYYPAGMVTMTTGEVKEGVVNMTTGCGLYDHSGCGQYDHLTSESLTSDSTLEGSEREKGNPREARKESKQEPKTESSPSNSSSSSPSRGTEIAAAPGGVPPGGSKGDVWVKYDTPEWDRVQRFGPRAVGKVFLRYGRLEGLWILKSDLKAIEVMANGGGQ